MKALKILLFSIIMISSLKSTGNTNPNPIMEDTKGVVYALTGAVGPNEATLSFKCNVKGKYIVELKESDTGNVILSKKLKIRPNTGLFSKVEFLDLKEDTRYYYEIKASKKKFQSKKGSFKTFKTGAFTYKVAFGSCADTGSDSRIFRVIKEQEPLFYLNTGDLHYGDIGENCVSSFDSVYSMVFTSPSQSHLYKDVPMAYIWDDHDYGPNNSGMENPCRNAALDAYRRFIPHYPTALDPPEGPISQSFEVGRVVFVLTDLRSQKVKPEYDGCTRTKIGSNFGSEEHLEWFFNTLKNARDAGKAVAWINPIPWINASGGPNYKCNEKDNWGGYPEERERIANFIRDEKIQLFILSGDAHMVAIDDGTNSDYATGGGSKIRVFHAAPLDRDGSYKGGPYSNGYSKERGQFGVMDVIDYGGEELFIQWTALDLNSQRVTDERLKRIETRFRLDLKKP
jgi:phosphodiesterase/alkaline phosphatase D-like protein